MEAVLSIEPSHNFQNMFRINLVYLGLRGDYSNQYATKPVYGLSYTNKCNLIYQQQFTILLDWRPSILTEHIEICY